MISSVKQHQMIRIIRLILFLFPTVSVAQTVDMNQLVTFRFQNERLGYVLSEVSRRYAIPFSYSSSFIPVDKIIRINERKVPLKYGLNKLFEPTKIVYAVIGNHIVLKIDESKEVIPIFEEPIQRQHEIESEELAPLKKYRYPILVWEHKIPTSVLEQMKSIPPPPELTVPEKVEEFGEKEIMQVTLIPPLSTNKEKAEKVTNTFSFNILWGRNGGLDGIEIGGFVNTILNDMSGFQLAGIGNQVDGNAQGIQMAFIYNYNKNHTKGVQLAGLWNVANTANVIQFTGLTNVIQESFQGVQAAIIGNYTRKRAEGIQAAGLFNYSKGYAKTQVSIGVNMASEVDFAQIGLVNAANYVKGKQIGLFNFADKIDGTPIGLLSIAQNGYNKIELGVSEALFVNAGVKLGVRKFYNIIQLGARFTKNIWSLGYGIGTSILLKEKQHFHLEYILSQINEKEVWTKTPNLLNQFRFNYDWQVSQRMSFFIGPSWNVIASKIKNTETQEVIGSNLPDYTLLNITKKNTNWKMWFGLNAGVRF